MPGAEHQDRFTGQVAALQPGVEGGDAAVVDIGAALGNDSPGLALALGQSGLDQGVDQRQPVAGQPPARQLLAGDVGENAGQLGVGQLADLGAEEDFRGPLGAGQALVAVDQPGQFGGQPPLRRPPARIGRVLGQQRRRSPLGPGR